MGFLTPKRASKGSEDAARKKAQVVAVAENEQEKAERLAAKKIEAAARGRAARLIVEQKAGVKLKPPSPLQRGVSFGHGLTIGESAGPPPISFSDFLEQLTRKIAACLGPTACSEAEEVPVPASKMAAANVEQPAKLISSDKELLHFHSSKKPLSTAMMAEVDALFHKIDDNGDGTITFDEARKFWKSNFSKVNAQAMFNEVDDDVNGCVTYEEWVDFWRNVVAQPDYSEEDVIEELLSIKEGGSWVDFNDGRETGETPLTIAIKAETKAQTKSV